ncbi:metallophosphoesterase [Ensifer soli]|uniref:metallophosphoesterase n=1 Tax=Ciceribacter sp. sgz301302 TaxID=3342379 RepID=UPI0035B866E1
MDIIEHGQRITLLGDPHLGRSFVHGVPLHRRGEREATVWQDFVASIRQSDDCDYHICLGDLFDRWIVPFDLILDVADVYKAAAAERPATTFVILKGNHDWTRDLTRCSAFDVFAALVADIANILVVTDVVKRDGLTFYPWHPLWQAKDKLKGLSGVLFGHFDVEFGDHNQVPTKLQFERIYTGHDHKARRLVRDCTEVIVVGSMQPYAHGEEGNDDLYVTLNAADIAPAEMMSDTRDRRLASLRNRCVRIVGPFDGEIDCLQLTLARDSTASPDGEIGTVALGAFDMETLFSEAFAEAGVSAARTADSLTRYQTQRSAQGGGI